MFKDLQKRLKQEIKRKVDYCLKYSEAISGHKVQEIDVKVISHALQRYAVWVGGSLVASTGEFDHLCHTKSEYEERGPSICRHSPAFSVLQ
eukprot:m.491941 g.491941  ORF g.491941 m.491941 type:complete len:91 (-) comp57273_c0_seq2:175-447(-)